jgi:hypothetical protein
MSSDYTEREGFIIDIREAARRTIQFGNRNKAETAGKVYITNFSLNWREPVTKASEVPEVPEAEPANRE